MKTAAASAPELLEVLTELYMAVYGGNSVSLEDCINRSVKTDAFEQRIVSVITKAHGMKTEDKAAEVFNILKNKTQVEGRYIGGGDEPQIISFIDSEGCDHDSFIRSIAVEIVQVSASKDREIEELKEWKRQMLQAWSPVMYWMQDHSTLELGESISAECLRRCQEFEFQSKTIEELKEKINKTRDYLMEVTKAELTIEDVLVRLGYNRNGF